MIIFDNISLMFGWMKGRLLHPKSFFALFRRNSYSHDIVMLLRHICGNSKSDPLKVVFLILNVVILSWFYDTFVVTQNLYWTLISYIFLPNISSLSWFCETFVASRNLEKLQFFLNNVMILWCFCHNTECSLFVVLILNIITLSWFCDTFVANQNLSTEPS